jgi:hypothetical protein
MKIRLTDLQGKTTTHDFLDDLTAQAFAVNAREAGASVEVVDEDTEQ